MDCLERLKRRTRESRPRTATVRTLRDSAECPQSTAKTRRIHCSARNNKKEKKKKKERRKSGVIVCPTQEAYTCQSTLLILLHTRFRNTLHPIHQEDSQRTIEYDRAALSRSSRGLVSFDTLLHYLCWENTISIQLPYLNALEESLIDALRLLHSRNISFPVSVEDIEFSRHWQSDCGDIKTFKLFLPYNKKASWASDNLPPTWKADQLESARSIFFIPKLLARLGASSKPTILDLASQQALATYLRENPTSRHEKYCLGITPATAELTHQIAYNLVLRSMAEKSREVLESFFGGPMPLPEPGTSPDTIYRNFSNLRARAIESEEHHGSSTGLSQDLEIKLLVDSPALVTRFICCRAEVARILSASDRRQWWLIAMDLYDAFLSSQGPSTNLDWICTYDLYHYRGQET